MEPMPMSPVPESSSEDQYPHPLRNVLCDQKKVRLNLTTNVLEQLQLEPELSEFEIVELMWNHLYQMQTILNTDPLPRQNLGREDRQNPIDYQWPYAETDILLYKHRAETFYQLFKMM